MKRFTLPLLLAALMMAGSAHAAQLSPVRLLVQPGQKSASLQIQNDGDAEATYDIRIKSWVGMDEAGVDTLLDTDAVITSRPVVTIPAGKSATIRFVVTGRTSPSQDNYRVMVTDITPVAANAGAVVRVKSVLPLFVSSDANSKGKLELKDGKVTNVGTRHVRIIGYKDASGAETKTLRYVLPGQSLKLPIVSTRDITINESVN
jgi:P pilus assembly chaperone PapD